MKVKHKGQIFYCKTCGNEIIVTKVGDGEIFCCGKPMEMVVENSDIETEEEYEESEE